MSDDGATFDGGNMFLDEEEEPADEVKQEEGQNKTFIIAVGVLGGLLVCAIGAFLVWAVILNPRIQAQNRLAEVVEPTPTATVAATLEEVEPPTATPQPTDTPAPTATFTPVVGPTATPNPEDESSSATGATATPQPSPTPQRATATPTKAPATAARTPTPNATRTSYATTDRTPQAGLGEIALVVAAGVLLVILFVARRLRHV